MEQLRISIQDEIKTGRIGDPVFLRCFYQISHCEGQDAIDILIDLAYSWMHSEIEHTHFQKDDCQTTVLLQFADGESALLSTNYLIHGTRSPEIIDLHLIGSRGTIYYQGDLN